jgi:hypothetical protein
MFIYIHIHSYYKLFLYLNLCANIMLDGLSCSFTPISFLTTSGSFTSIWTWETIQHYTRTQIQVKEQLVVRKDMDVNEHERLSNIILGHKFKKRNRDSLSCSFTSIFFLTTNCSFTWICVLVWCWIVSHVHLHSYSFLQFVVRKNMDVNEHERLSNITLGHKFN